MAVHVFIYTSNVYSDISMDCRVYMFRLMTPDIAELHDIRAVSELRLSHLPSGLTVVRRRLRFFYQKRLIPAEDVRV